MVKILMHGCNGKMGRMITEIVKNEEDAVIAAGVDKFTGILNDYLYSGDTVLNKRLCIG